MSRLVGLSGYARSGKDTVAELLGFERVSFAQPMRDALFALNPVVAVDNSERKIRVQDVIGEYGWDGYKESFDGKEIRELMQRLGTEVGRKQWDEDFWVNIAMDKAIDLLDAGKSVVFTDVRFVNEAEKIQYYGGEVWRVNRPGIRPANGHVSETGMDGWVFDVVIDNDGTLDDLKGKVDGFI